jgi:ribonuclease HII|tara:strand:- start:47012 stop:47677 length:666 start_codon:yes stop_codon:yes gene_type:complete
MTKIASQSKVKTKKKEKSHEPLKLFLIKDRLEVGCDEAGRGCLAGPVVAAAVILDPENPIIGLNDSKKISHITRQKLRKEIEEKSLAWAVGLCSPDEIDEINILWASFKAMHKALDKIKIPFDHILVDGNRFTTYPEVGNTCIIKGDAKFQSIAAASIIAKEFRDDLMSKMHEEFPNYGWNQNKGYPTSIHRSGIEKFGPCIHHRKTFQLLPLIQTKLELD